MGFRTWFLNWLEDGLPDDDPYDDASETPSLSKQTIFVRQDHFLYVTVDTKIFELPLLAGVTLLTSMDRLNARELSILGLNGILIPCDKPKENK